MSSEAPCMYLVYWEKLFSIALRQSKQIVSVIVLKQYLQFQFSLRYCNCDLTQISLGETWALSPVILQVHKVGGRPPFGPRQYSNLLLGNLFVWKEEDTFQCILLNKNLEVVSDDNSPGEMTLNLLHCALFWVKRRSFCPPPGNGAFVFPLRPFLAFIWPCLVDT